MPARYFLTENAARTLQVNGRNYQFTPTQVVGTQLFGVYAAETPEAIVDLVSLIGRGAVEISEAEFEAQKKTIRPGASSASSSLRPALVPRLVSPSTDAQSAPPAKSAAPDPEKQVRVISLASVVRTGVVRSPNPLAEAAAPKER